MLRTALETWHTVLPTHLRVNEIFGPTIQGEGPAIGQPAAFLRLAGCNLACVWCDTRYSWDWHAYDKAAESHRMSVDEVAERLDVVRPGTRWSFLLVVTGGEPMLQQPALTALFASLDGWRIEIETAGTLGPYPGIDEFVSRYVVSPKLAHSGNDQAKRYRPTALEALSDTGKAAWKFVCQSPKDFDEVERLVAGLEGPVYIMPEGYDHETLISRLADLTPAAITRGWYVTPRLQVDLWGKARGV